MRSRICILAYADMYAYLSTRFLAMSMSAVTRINLNLIPNVIPNFRLVLKFLLWLVCDCKMCWNVYMLFANFDLLQGGL